MKRFAIVCSAVLILSSIVILSPAQADDFEVLWALNIPREVYFIGETVTIEVLAFASGEVMIFLPGEMALVTIRNASLAEMYAGWVTTDQNGSAIVSWDIPLESSPDNYTVILAPIVGESYVKTFTSLFDQDTYWMKRVEQLEDELNRQYEYLNYLFGATKYLNRQVDILRGRVAIMGVVMFITIMATLAVVIPEWARRSTNYRPKSMSSKLARLMGFTSTPKVLLSDQHDELAQLKTPAGKEPPRYGLDYHCQFCDPEKKEPLTKGQYEEHLMSHYRPTWNLSARRRNSVYKQLINEHYQIPESRPPHEEILKAEKKREEIIDSIELSRKELRAIAAEKKRLETEALAEKKRIEKERKQKAKDMKKSKKVKKRKEKPVPIIPTSQMPQTQRKARRIKAQSTPPEPPPPTEIDPIDELFERLSNEKVN